jgi:hypothetical protein
MPPKAADATPPPVTATPGPETAAAGATASKKKSKKAPERIDLEPSIEAVLATLPEKTEIEISSVKGGKRIDLIRADGQSIRLVSGLAKRDVKWYLEGMAKRSQIG